MERTSPLVRVSPKSSSPCLRRYPFVAVLYSSPPLQIHNPAMFLVRLIEAPQFEAHAFVFQRSVDPSRRVALLKQVCHRWQIDKVNTGRILVHFPMMRVAEKVSLDLINLPPVAYLFQ